MLRIKSIRINKDKVKINYDENTEDGQWINYAIKSPEMPLPEFQTALQNFAEDICTINELPPENTDELTVTGLTYVYKDSTEDFKIIIISKKPIKLSNSPRNIITPLVDLGLANENADNYQYLEDLKNKSLDIQDFARAYINGERIKSPQPSLFENINEDLQQINADITN